MKFLKVSILTLATTVVALLSDCKFNQSNSNKEDAKKYSKMESPDMGQIKKVISDSLSKSGDFKESEFNIDIVDLERSIVIEVSIQKSRYQVMRAFFIKNDSSLREELKKLEDKPIVFEVIED